MSARGAGSPPVAIPTELDDALRGAKLLHAFESLPPSHRREHASYVSEGAKSATRRRRAERCIGMIQADLGAETSPTVVVRIDDERD